MVEDQVWHDGRAMRPTPIVLLHIMSLITYTMLPNMSYYCCSNGLGLVTTISGVNPSNL